MSTIATELRQKAHKLVVDAQADLTSPKLDAEIEARADAQLIEAKSLEARARKIEEAEEMEARMSAVDTSKRPTTEARAIETESRSVNDEFRSYLRTGREGDQMRGLRSSIEYRDQIAGNNGQGGYTVPTDFYNQLTVSLINWSPLGNPDITQVLETSDGRNLQFPLLNDTANMGYVIGEGNGSNNAVNSANAMTFTQVTLGAHTFTSDIIRVSYELLEDSGIDIQSWLVNQASQRIGRAMGTAFTTGGGTTTATGIINSANTVSGAATATANAGSIAYGDLLGVYHSTEPAYRNLPKFAWGMNDNTLMQIRKLVDANGRPLIDYANPLDQGEPDVLFGKKIYINQAMANIGTAALPIIVGDHNGFMVRKVGGIQVARLVERYIEYRQVGFAFFTRADSNLLDNKALKLLYVK